KGLGSEERRTYTSRSKETLGVDEGALGSEKESRQIAAAIATRIEQLLGAIAKILGSQSNCSREDSNLHGLPHTVLSRTRLPVPPREQKQRALTMRAWQRACKMETGESDGLSQLDRFLCARNSN